MKKIAGNLLILLFIAIVTMSFVANEKKTKVLFFGDSITQKGITPGGYITQMDSLLKLQGNENYELVGAGVSGNKVYDLYLRMEQDVLDRKPDIVVIYVGINDVWHKTTAGTGTDPDKYERFYRAIIKKLLDKNIKVIVCTPTVIGEKKDFCNQNDGDLNKYSQIIMSIAQSNKLQVCDLRKTFVDYEQLNNTKNVDRGFLTLDRVHLNNAGNALVANELLKYLK